MLSVLEEGDEAVLFDPAWVSYDPAIMLAGAKTVWAATRRDNGFSPVDVNEYITRKTKIIVVNSPCNPTGGVYDRATLKEIADIAVDKNIMVLSDEIYEKIIYDKEHISIGSMDGLEAWVREYSKRNLRKYDETPFPFREPGNIVCPVCGCCSLTGRPDMRYRYGA
jgi:aspartate aminotransferase